MGTSRTTVPYLPAIPIITAALLIVGQALTPAGLDRPITTTATALRELPIAARHSRQLYLANLLVVFGLAALGVTFSIIRWAVRGRDSRPAVCAAAFGAFCGALGNLTIGLILGNQP